MNQRMRATAAIVPLLLVNGIAVTGQMIYWRSHLPWPLAAVVLFALALESVSVYLAYHAHLAQISDDSALRLRLASYGFGIVTGLMNGSHYTHDGKITAAAVGMALMSSSSPWLWAVHSRRANRDQLRAAGLIDPHSVRLGATRWTWHAYRSARVMWYATWAGVRKPDEAIALWERRTGQRNPRHKAVAAAPGGDIRTWAQSRGMKISATGRIPASVRLAYEAEHRPGAVAAGFDPDATAVMPAISPFAAPVTGKRVVTVASGGRYAIDDD